MLDGAEKLWKKWERWRLSKDAESGKKRAIDGVCYIEPSTATESCRDERKIRVTSNGAYEGIRVIFVTVKSDVALSGLASVYGR